MTLRPWFARLCVAASILSPLVMSACNPGDELNSADAQLPDQLRGFRVEITILASETPALLTPGSVIVYQFIDDDRVLGDGPDTTLPTKSWTFTRTGPRTATVLLDYGQAGTERYDLRVDEDLRGSCEMAVHQVIVGTDGRDLFATCSFALSEGVDL